ncbi:hypothetical protein C8A03DRAFT_32283 [Achaetomium macrosporum]|uniref:ATP-dependent DNA ligase family profile domain-containing protein n=1 Tax=Achaetomium macrosporum TaxID=79813 RepID=A0AAN7CDR9_9PEZI|nr:hypothetical protein C8A03DRAFT_32283 [Achaetomium macrosporum]
MPFLFSYVCDLLQLVEDNHNARSGLRSNAAIIQDWFSGHQGLLHRDHNSGALLSALLPEKRTDRVYCLGAKRLQAIIGRALGLGRSRIAELRRWQNPGACVDLAECVESILRATPNPIFPAHRPVTIEEIDEILLGIAAACRFSSPAVRISASENRPADQVPSLGGLYKRLSARDAKWLTRLILKNYEPVVLDQHVVCAGYHRLLPQILQVQDDLAVAGRILDSQRRDRTVTGRSELAEYLKPTLGVKIGRQTWLKGRSIKHCLSMVQGRVSCEEKIDGEYCQIHIDLSKGYDCIQIFSKSGKDSTKDRIALHDSIRKSLQLGTASCPLKTGCILEGELVVYSDKHSKVLDFHKIRKHVSRSGSFLGTKNDSQPQPWEHLMIVYYDLLMVDNESLLAVKHSERFQRLKDLITQVPGRSALVKREVIDCSRPSAVSDLRRAFAKCITARGEGLVLRADDPYFDFGTLRRRPYSCCAIKLKKEYIGCFGDVGDFAVVGARFDAAKARIYNIRGLKWTHFYVGCLENKEEVQRFGKQPRFVVTNAVELNAAQLEAFITFVNPESVPPEDNTAISLRIEPGIDNGKRPSVIFPTPPVFDIRCFSFDKVGNAGFWSPRFPSVSKMHYDRSYCDAISFDLLQEMATQEKEMPRPEDSQELLGWIAALERSEPTTTVETTSQSTVSTITAQAPSPQKPMGPDCRHPSTAPISPTKEKTGPKRQAQAAPVDGQLTPPRSSAAKMSEPTSQKQIGDQEEAALGRKRSLESSTENNLPEERKRIRRCTSDRVHPSTNHMEPRVEPRMTLSRRNTEAPVAMPGLSSMALVHNSDLEKGDAQERGTIRSLQTCVSFHETVSTSFSAQSPSTEATSSLAEGVDTASRPPERSIETATGSCRYLGDACKLATHSIILSPCIANFPWVAEDLLSCHGVTDFIRDPKEWLDTRHVTQANLPVPSGITSASAPSSTADGTSSRGRRRRKIALVDARRREATLAFLQSIEAAQLKRRNGEREYVAVYDWRVLESIREEEQMCGRNRERPGNRFDLNSSLWRRFWVGLA